jgi:hypothetical protein
MEFSIWCPDDGTMQVGLEDIDSIVLRSKSAVEVVFTCPTCGRRITLTADVPQTMLAAFDDSWAHAEGAGEESIKIQIVRDEDAAPEPVPSAPPEEDSRIESYCEFFRRELLDIETVGDILAQMGGQDS